MFPIIEGAGFPIIQRIAPQPCRAFPPSLPIFAGLLVGIWIAMACDEGLRGLLFFCVSKGDLEAEAARGIVIEREFS